MSIREAAAIGDMPMSASGRLLSFVTACDFSDPASCYAGLTAGFGETRTYILAVMLKKNTYPIPALAQQIELAWTEELASYYGRTPQEVTEEVRPWFLFPTGTLRIELMDESCVEFRNAIYIVNETKRAIAVFTEHCGHHLYPYHDARIYRDGELVYGQFSA